MSDYVEVISMPYPKEEPVESDCSSNEVISTFNLNNYHCTSNLTSLLDGKKDIEGQQFVTSLRNKVKNDVHEYNKAELIAKERRWIGTLVTKIFDGETYMGHVVDFDEETERFKIVYEDSEKEEDSDKQEEVCKDELRTLVPDPKLVCEYLDRIEARKNEKKKKKKKEEKKRDVTTATASTSFKKCWPSKSSNRTKGKQVKGKKSGNSAQILATYVPLAIKEKKKDAYIWY